MNKLIPTEVIFGIAIILCFLVWFQIEDLKKENKELKQEVVKKEVEKEIVGFEEKYKAKKEVIKNENNTSSIDVNLTNGYHIIKF